ncbi:MAG TPA: hypothetical protein VFQ61_10450 [Polyangiaceae bacterium]|nr:hypothetical protein [Polyangiaceae bacterium]
MSTFEELASELTLRDSARAILRRHLLPEFGALPIDQLDVERIERFKAERMAAGTHPKTLNNLLVVIRAVLQLAVERGAIAAVPIVRSLPLAERARAALPLDQARALARVTEPVFHTMALLALLCGLRLRELRNLRWSDLQLEKATLRVGTREFPLTRPLLLALSEQPQLSPWLFTLDGNQLTHGSAGKYCATPSIQYLFDLSLYSV